MPGAADRKRRRPAGVGERVERVDLDELCRRAGISRELAKELEDYGLLAPSGTGGNRVYPESDVDVAAVCAQLQQYGVAPRHLRTFRRAIDRETSLLEQVVAPALRARNAERRAAGVRDLQTLGELAQELSALLLWRDLRDVANA